MAWATSKNRYSAQINGKSMLVDLFDLPYADFNAENPLIVQGPVVLTENNRTTDLTNVRIIGGLDISKQKVLVILPKHVDGPFICRSNPQMRNLETKIKTNVFDENFVFPDGITEIDCSHSVSDLSVFFNIPSTVKRIIVADSLLANIPADIEKFASAKKFQEKFPALEIVGDKKGITLSEILATGPVVIEVKEEVSELPELPLSESVSAPQPEKPLKTDEFCDAKDIFDIMKADLKKQKIKMLDSTLEREIRRLMAKFDLKELKNPETNRIVMCITKQDASMLLKTLKQKIAQKQGKQPVAQTTSADIVKQPLSELVATIQETRVKTEDFVNVKDILNEPQIKSLKVSKDLLAKEIRKNMVAFGVQLRVDPETQSATSCILRSCLPEFIEKLVYGSHKPVKKTTAKKAVQKTTKKVVETPKQTEMPKTKKKAEILQIKKYIPRALWKDICKMCGKDPIVIKSVLDTINSVNTDIADTVSSNNLQIIDPKTGIRTISSYMKKEFINCVIQSISDCWFRDNKRIVWSYLPEDHVLVCTCVYAEHTNTKSKNHYKKIRMLASDCKNAKGEDITLHKILHEKYFDVDDLSGYTQQLTTELQTNTEPKEEAVKDTVPAKSPVSESASATRSRKRIKTAHTEAVLVCSSHGPVRTKKEKIVAPVDTPKQEKTPVQTAVEPQPQKEQIMAIESPKDLSDIITAQAQIEAVINLINKITNERMITILNEPNSTKQLEGLALVRTAIQKKEKIQKFLPELAETEKILSQIIGKATTIQK